MSCHFIGVPTRMNTSVASSSCHFCCCCSFVHSLIELTDVYLKGIFFLKFVLLMNNDFFLGVFCIFLKMIFWEGKCAWFSMYCHYSFEFLFFLGKWLADEWINTNGSNKLRILEWKFYSCQNLTNENWFLFW